MIIKFGGKRYYILEERPPSPLNPYSPEMWGDIESRIKFGIHHHMIQKFTRVGAPKPIRKYTPEEAADKLASIEKKDPPSTIDSLLAYNKAVLHMMAGQVQFNPRTLGDWLSTSPGFNPCTSSCSITHIPPCSAFGDCGITGCSNTSCAPCTTSFYGNIGV